MKIFYKIILLFCSSTMQTIDPLTILGFASLGISITRWSYNTARWYFYPTKQQELAQEIEWAEKEKERVHLNIHDCHKLHPHQSSKCEIFYQKWKIITGFRKEAR